VTAFSALTRPVKVRTDSMAVSIIAANTTRQSAAEMRVARFASSGAGERLGAG
jgi:hypothetical protein